MRRRFHTLDVFTEKRLAGNPLAVVLDSAGLDDAAMLAVTREFNLSETVFVSDPADPVNTAAIRIFTPGGELPFAGHPTVGTAVLLASLRAADMMKGAGVTIALEENIGLVKVDVTRPQGRAARGVFTIPKASERLDIAVDSSAAARALGIDAGLIGYGRHQLSVWSAGGPFVMVPLKSLAAVAAAGVADRQAWASAMGAAGKGAAYVYCAQTLKPGHHIHARMFWPGTGITEDPATGSAAAAFSGAYAAAEALADGTHQIVIEQGYEMGRSSEIVLDMDVSAGALTAARIGGGAVLISEGVIDV